MQWQVAIVQLWVSGGGDLFLDSFATADVDMNVTLTSKLGRLILGLGCIVRQLDSAQIELHLQPRRQWSSLPGSRPLVATGVETSGPELPAANKMTQGRADVLPGFPSPRTS